MSLDAALAARMDASLIGYWGAYGHAPASFYREFPGGIVSYTPIPLALFNTVILTSQDPASIDVALELAAQCIAERGLPVLWRLSATAATPAVHEHLGRAGLERRGQDPAMLRDLTDLPEPPTVTGMTIRAAEGKSERHDWAWLASDAFGLDAATRAAMSRCEAEIPEELFADQPRFVGYLDGTPAAVSSLVMTDGIAGIYAVATLPEARKRGMGTAMTLHAMAEGKRRRAREAVLQATEMGRPVYEKIGFSTVHGYDLYLQT